MPNLPGTYGAGNYGAGPYGQLAVSTTSVTVLLAGQDITSTVQEPSILVESALGQGPGVPGGLSGRATTAQFLTSIGPAASAIGAGQTLPPTPTLVRQGEVLIYDATGTKIFGGYAVRMDDVTVKKQPFTQVACHDYWQDLDRVQVNKVYTGNTDTFILQDIITTYAPWIGLSLVNLGVANYTFPKLFVRQKSVMQVLQKIADTTGFDLWVDANKNLHYVKPTNLGTAPFGLSDAPDNFATFPYQVTHYEQDDNAIINRVTCYGGKFPTADFTQDLTNQANGTNTTFSLAYYPRESSNKHIQVFVNGVAQVVGYANSAGAANILKSQGGTADVLVNPDAQALTFNVAPGSGINVHAIYRYDTPLLVQLTSNPSLAYFGRYYDGVIADPTILDSNTAITRCRILLSEQAYGFTHLTVKTWTPGLVAGTQIRVDSSVRNIHNTFAIQEVHAQAQGGGFFEYEVVLGAWNWQIADMLLAAARYATPQDDYTTENTTPLQVSQASFSVNVHDAWTLKVGTSGWYYARAMAVGDGHDAYSGFFTLAPGLPVAVCSNSSPGLLLGFSGSANVIAYGHVA